MKKCNFISFRKKNAIKFMQNNTERELVKEIPDHFQDKFKNVEFT